jgi:hypothetical protein
MNDHERLISRLRSALANKIADAKAYDVPAFCERLGLPSGTSQEAFNSKFRYAATRLNALRPDRVVDTARLLLQEADSFEVSELLAKLEEYERTHVSELTRRRVAAVFNGAPLVTETDDIDFIRRLWPIAEMPSPYAGTPLTRERTLEDSIYQHAIRNDDWSQQELLEHLGLLTCSQQQFFRFLEEVTDPIAQSAERQATLVEELNRHLREDGFLLEVKRRMSGSPVYAVGEVNKGVPSDEAISVTLKAFNPQAVHARWQQALDRRSSNPEGAITLARTLLEDVCKWILHEAGETYEERDDLPMLYRKLAAVLNLAPDLHTETIFKQILGSCQSIVESLGSLRNKIGDAHSEGPLRVKPSARHAELAVNLSGTMATFLVSTWWSRQQKTNSPNTGPS